jgi:hypothetical protein
LTTSGGFSSYVGYLTGGSQPVAQTCASFARVIDAAVDFCDTNASRVQSLACTQAGVGEFVLTGASGTSCATTVARLNAIIAEYAFGNTTVASYQCSPTGFIRRATAGCGISAYVINDLADSIQRLQTTECLETPRADPSQHIRVEFAPGSCPLTADNSLRAKLQIANALVFGGLQTRDDIVNVTLQCFTTTLVAKAYSRRPKATLATIASAVTNTGVTVSGLVSRGPFTSVLVIAHDDESTTPTTTITTTVTTSPTTSTTATSTLTTTLTTTVTTSQTTTAIHGRLECLSVAGAEHITIEADKCAQQIALLTGVMQSCYDGNTVFPTVSCVSIDGTPTGAKILHSNACSPHGTNLLNLVIHQFAFPLNLNGA